MVYNPLETQLLRKAKAAGREIIPGIEMFVEQAAAQFEIWTGEKAPRTIMRNAVAEALGA
jgi:shikimate 5-dehydrogenase